MLNIARAAGAVIHTHSKAAVIVTLLNKTNDFEVTHLELIKVSITLLKLGFCESQFIFQGIYNPKFGRCYPYDEELTVPIIENTPFEEDLQDRMTEILSNIRKRPPFWYGDTASTFGGKRGNSRKQCE